MAHKTFLTTVGTVSDGCRSLLADRNRTWDGHPPRNEESDLSTDPPSSGLKIRTQGNGGCVPCPWPIWLPSQPAFFPYEGAVLLWIPPYPQA